MSDQEPTIHPNPKDSQPDKTAESTPEPQGADPENSLADLIKNELGENDDPKSILRGIAEPHKGEDVLGYDKACVERVRENLKALFHPGEGVVKTEDEEKALTEQILRDADLLLNFKGTTNEEIGTILRTVNSVVILLGDEELTKRLESGVVDGLEGFLGSHFDGNEKIIIDILQRIRTSGSTEEKKDLGEKIVSHLDSFQNTLGGENASSVLGFLVGLRDPNTFGDNTARAIDQFVSKNIFSITDHIKNGSPQSSEITEILSSTYFTNYEDSELSQDVSEIKRIVLGKFSSDKYKDLVKMAVESKRGFAILHELARTDPTMAERILDECTTLDVTRDSLRYVVGVMRVVKREHGESNEYGAESAVGALDRTSQILFQMLRDTVGTDRQPSYYDLLSLSEYASPSTLSIFTQEALAKMGQRGPNSQALEFLCSIRQEQELKQEIARFIEKNYDQIENDFLKKPKDDFDEPYQKTMAYVALYGSEEVGSKAVDALVKVAGIDSNTFFAKFGLDRNHMLSSWRQAPYLELLEENVGTMNMLEEKSPGSVRTLSQQYGITQFGRYPPEILVRQVESVDEKGPHGLVIFPEYDHNNAFGGTREIAMFRQLQASLDVVGQKGPPVRLRIAEAGSPFDVAKRIRTMQGKYGPASFMILGAHGSEDAISFGYKDNKSVTTETILSDAIPVLGEALQQDATLILQSCSTGVDNGIGHKLSNRIPGRRVIAPKEDAGGIVKIDVKRDEHGVLFFDVEFGGTKESHFMDGSSISASDTTQAA